MIGGGSRIPLFLQSVK